MTPVDSRGTRIGEGVCGFGIIHVPTGDKTAEGILGGLGGWLSIRIKDCLDGLGHKLSVSGVSTSLTKPFSLACLPLSSAVLSNLSSAKASTEIGRR